MSRYAQKILFHPLNHLDFIRVDPSVITSAEQRLFDFLKKEKEIYEKYRIIFFDLTEVSSRKNYDTDVVYLHELLEELKNHIVERKKLIFHYSELKDNNKLNKLEKMTNKSQDKLIDLLLAISSRSYNPWKVTSLIIDVNDCLEEEKDYLLKIIKLDVDG